MQANDFKDGKKFKNKESGDIVEVVELENNIKMFESDYGRWFTLDKDLFDEI